MVIELRIVQFWSEIILVISNRTRAARSFDFEIMHMISDQIALHSVQLPLLIILVIKQIGLPLRGRPILLITRMIYRPNWTPLSPVTITDYLKTRLLKFGQINFKW